MSFTLKMHEAKTNGEPVQLKGTVEFKEKLKDRDDVSTADPLKVQLTARDMMDVIHVEGEVKASLLCTCSRCLTPNQKDFSVMIHEKFTQEKEIADADEDDNTHWVSSDRIDLIPFIHENVLLDIPFVPLCDEACKGLCPQCGQNLNEQSCDCKTEKIDPRLEGLKDFFES